MRKLFLLLTAILSFVTAKSETTETVDVDGIIYELHQSEYTGIRDTWFDNRVENWCAVVGYQSVESESITIPSNITNNGVEYTVRIISERAFSDCTSLKNINLPNTLSGLEVSAFARSGITSIDLKNTMVELIPSYCFLSCEQLSEVNLGSRQKFIEHDAFTDCIGIKTLKLPGTWVSTLPPNLESLYLADFNENLPEMDYSNITLYSTAKALPNYFEKYADSFKAYKVWDFEVADSVICDYDGEYKDIVFDNEPWPWLSPIIPNCIVAYENHPIRIPFSVKPANTLFKAIKVSTSKGHREYDREYDGEDAVIITFEKSPGEKDIYNKSDIYEIDVYPIFPESDTYPQEPSTTVQFIVLPDPDYPTSLQFKNSEVRIKPFEFYYQPVEILPEESTPPELTWSSSDPSMASVTQEGKVYPFVEEGTVTISVTDGKDLSASYTAIIDVNAAGIEGVTVDGDDTPVEYYNLNGIRVAADALSPGIYVRRQGSRSEKFIVK